MIIVTGGPDGSHSHRSRTAQVSAGVPNNVFVPTMGNCEGHLRLVGKPRRMVPCTVVSIFVNRLQFGPQEDFDRYPRTLADDCKSLESIDCDVVFAPDEKALPGTSDLPPCSRLALRTLGGRGATGSFSWCRQWSY